MYKHLEGVFSKAEMNCAADDYLRFIKFAKPEIIALPDKSSIELARPMITHRNDVPVLASALDAQPDWLISDNDKHFDQEVARRSGLRIGTAYKFVAEIHSRYRI